MYLFYGIGGTILMLALIVWGVPIAWSFVFVGAGGLMLILGPSVAIPQLEARLFEVVSMYSWTVVPLFVMMGEIAYHIGVISDLYDCSQKWAHRVKGALAIATVFAATGFGAVSGSSAGTAAAMSKMAFPEMKKKNYSSNFVGGVLSAGGTMGFIIPPSIAMVVYGNCTDTSVGQLMIAGILPGIILCIMFCAIIYFRVQFKPELAPIGFSDSIPFKEKILALKGILTPLAVFVFMLSGLYLGIFTPTEAGAVGVFLLIVLGLIRKKLTYAVLKTSFHEGVQVACMIFIIVYGALVFGDFLAFSRFTPIVVNGIARLEISPYLILAMFVGIILLMGCILEAISVIIIATPLMFPVIDRLGFDPVWFGIVFVLLTQAGTITPPVGVNVYVVNAIMKGQLDMIQVFKECVPFLVAIILLIVLLTIFPNIATYLPSLTVKV
ncbi:MAG: Sialic acid TRAP transporter permease protein SiaT [Syntrophorhabdus sp. PtaU1.Bin050]|nr:MAG: Sialic acid TRAP transporter permease protein SiaT [Syntrophorhabdus sp. PtaU1.Bin050]